MNTSGDNTPISNEVDVAIIGGGLSGLNAAHQLYKHGVNFQIFEASNRLGGRIVSVHSADSGRYMGDLGATWVWPAYQPHIVSGLKRLGLTTYPQYEEGNAVFDTQLDQPPLHQLLPAQHGIARIDGGPQAFIDALIAKLPSEKLNINCTVSSIEKAGHHFALGFKEAEYATVNAKFIIIAAPVRLVAMSIAWNGLLDDDIVSIMQNTPTWMASHAKVLISYKHAFWRAQGLSGRVASQLGPMAEIHDHCGREGQPASLFSFVGWSAEQRQHDDLEAAIKTQLVRCFGAEAAEFTHLTIKDWAQDHSICSKHDLAETPYHPERINNLIRQGQANDRIFFAAAETAKHSPGLLDGAFEAGERAAKQVMSKIKASPSI